MSDSEQNPDSSTSSKRDDDSILDTINTTNTETDGIEGVESSPQTDETAPIPASVPNDSTLPRGDDDRPMTEPTHKQNRFLALGIAVVLLAIFIGGWLYRDEIFDFLKGLFTGKKKKDLDDNHREELK